jgi:hypothetical protein
VGKALPNILDKIPGGKAINRAFIREYRGDLDKSEDFIKSMDEKEQQRLIGAEYAIDLGQRLQAVSEASQLRLGEYIRGEQSAEDLDLTAKEKALGDEARKAMLDLGRQAVDVGLLAEETFFKNAGRYMPRLYTSKEYKALLGKYGLTKPNRLDLSRFKKRKDIPKKIREEMGEILTPGYPIAKGIMQMSHDIATARWFNRIAANPNWARPDTQFKVLAANEDATKWGVWQGDKNIGVYDKYTDATKARTAAAQAWNKSNPVPEGWQRLPEGKKLGALSGAYVHPEIHADMEQAIKVATQGEKIWRKALGSWKFGKVILSPKTHARNLMSNSVLAHLGGMPMYEQPIYLTRAWRDMRAGGKYWKMAKRTGLTKSTWTAGELKNLFDQVNGQLSGVKAGGLADKYGIIGEALAKAKKAGKKAADIYELEEQWFKVAKLMHNVERRGMDEQAAAKDAEKWLFNYGKLTKFQEKYRSSWYGAPFSTFTFKALPRIAEAAVKYPWRFALPGYMIYALQKAAMDAIGDDDDQFEAKKQLRQKYMREGIVSRAMHIPNFARVPLVDQYGREHYLNLTYVLPWGDIAEGGGFGPIPGGLMPFSQPFLKTAIEQIGGTEDLLGPGGFSWFFKDEIVKPEDVEGKTTMGKLKTVSQKRGSHLVKSLAPTPVLDAMKLVDAMQDRPDYRGRLRDPRVVALDALAGIKIYPVSYLEQFTRELYKKDPGKGVVGRKLMSQYKTLSIQQRAVAKAGGNVKPYQDRKREIQAQLIGLATEAKELAKLYKQAFPDQ